ncbi:MAG: hypothetical protein J3K34DRAFT_373446, partial [Monoraphidium minutum]
MVGAVKTAMRLLRGARLAPAAAASRAAAARRPSGARAYCPRPIPPLAGASSTPVLTSTTAARLCHSWCLYSVPARQCMPGAGSAAPRSSPQLHFAFAPPRPRACGRRGAAPLGEGRPRRLPRAEHDPSPARTLCMSFCRFSHPRSCHHHKQHNSRHRPHARLFPLTPAIHGRLEALDFWAAGPQGRRTPTRFRCKERSA